MRVLVFLLCLFNYCSGLNIDIPNNLKPSISILVADAQNGKVKYSLNPNEARPIASNMKLFTTYFALNELKPDFHWQTKLLYSGNVSGGVLCGNIYLIGGGDPTLDAKAIYEILSTLKQKGITQINGNIIIDNTIFNSSPQYSFLDTNPFDVDAIMPSGLMINSEINHVILSTNKESPTINSDLYGFKLINNIKVSVTESVCSSLYKKIKIQKYLNEITLSGNVSSNCVNKQLVYRFLSNFAYNRAVIYKTLNDFNIILTGDIIDGKLGKGNAKLLYTYNSPSLEEVLITMNRFSVDLIAEALVLTVGAYKTSNHNTYLQGKNEFIKFLTRHQLLNKDTIIENGAGLSRYERFSVKNIVDLLIQVEHSPYKSEFIATLPVPGYEGSLKNRYVEYQNYVHAKTGTLNDTRSLSGYYTAANGKNYIFSIVFNDIDANVLSESQLKQINGIILSIFRQVQDSISRSAPSLIISR